MESKTHVLGDRAQVKFVTFGNKDVEGKVDTGATTSSLDAQNIKVNEKQVTFTCPTLGNATFTMNLAGEQDVLSADGGAKERPMIKVDIQINNGETLTDVIFNLNDRQGMDTPVLIGQNILKSGNYVVDVTKSELSVEQQIIDAVNVLREHKITLHDLFTLIKTEVVNTVKD